MQTKPEKKVQFDPKKLEAVLDGQAVMGWNDIRRISSIASDIEKLVSPRSTILAHGDPEFSMPHVAWWQGPYVEFLIGQCENSVWRHVEWVGGLKDTGLWTLQPKTIERQPANWPIFVTYRYPEAIGEWREQNKTGHLARICPQGDVVWANLDGSVERLAPELVRALQPEWAYTSRAIDFANFAPFPLAKDLTGWEHKSARPLDLEWIKNDWPHALIDDEYILVWKRVARLIHIHTHCPPPRADLGEPGRYGWIQRNMIKSVTHRGVLGCPYAPGEPVCLNGTSNWLLSPLGAAKENAEMTEILVAVTHVDRLRMREDQVLAAGPGCWVLPLAVFPAKEMFAEFPEWYVRPEREVAESLADEDIELFLKVAMWESGHILARAARRWLNAPNLHAEKIDGFESYFGNKAKDALNDFSWPYTLTQGLMNPNEMETYDLELKEPT